MRACEKKVADITRHICDVSKYSTTTKEDAPYRDFAPYRAMFIRHLLEDSSDAVCFGGTFNLWVASSTGEKYLPAVIYHAPNMNKCRGTKKYESVMYFIGTTFYHLSREEKKVYDKKSSDRAKEAFLRPLGSYAGHASALLIDNKQGFAEFFDPNGGTLSTELDAVTNPLKKWLRQRYPTYDFRDDLYSFCPRRGPQAVSRDSRCGNWALLYMYLRLQCPELSPRKLQTYLAGRGKLYLNKLMPGWMCFMWAYAHEHGLIKQFDAIQRRREKARDTVEKFRNATHSRAIQSFIRLRDASRQVISFIAGTFRS